MVPTWPLLLWPGNSLVPRPAPVWLHESRDFPSCNRKSCGPGNEATLVSEYTYSSSATMIRGYYDECMYMYMYIVTISASVPPRVFIL